jgi:Protein of unknown function (DUF3179)
MVCHSGVGLTPVVDGEVHHLSTGGLYNGLVLLIDDETRSYWDHTRGDAVHGPLAGTQLEVWPIQVTTVAAELSAHPETDYARSKPGLLGRAIGSFTSRTRGGLLGQGLIPPGFRRTMGDADERRAALEHGVGVIVDGRARYYPMAVAREGLVDEWDGRALRIEVGEQGVPAATWSDDGSLPMQVFTRWYGFSFTYPGCEIFSG